MSGKLIQQLEERIYDQKLIIDFLKKNNATEEFVNKTVNQTMIENAPLNLSEYKGNNQEAKKLSVDKKTQSVKSFDRQM